MQHSHEHRKDSGRFGDFFAADQEVQKWAVNEGGHEFALIPYVVPDPTASKFRGKGQRFNLVWKEDQEPSDYRLTVLTHYNIGANADTVICPRTVGDPCPLCEERGRLDDEDPGFKALSPTRRTLYNVVVLDNDKERDKGVQVWIAPTQSIENELTARANKGGRTGQKAVWDPYEGYTVTFERTGKNINTEYTGLDIDKPKDPPFTDDEIQDLLKAALVFDDVVEVKSYKDLQELLKGTKPREEREDGDKPRGRGRYEDEEPPSKERRSSRYSKEPPAEEPEPARGRSRKPEPEPEPEEDDIPFDKGRGSEDEEPTAPAKPKCWGMQCNLIPDCETCPEGTFGDCYKQFQSKKSKAGGRK